MGREVVSDKQAICMIITYMTGSSSMMVMGVQAKKDVWIAVILGIFAGLVPGFILAQVHRIFPGKNLYDIIEICFGKIFGKILIILFVWYIYHSGLIVIRNIAQFINTVSMPETPLIVMIIFITALGRWAVREGIETMGRGATLLIVPYTVSILILVVLLIPKMDINNLRPVLYGGFAPVLRGAAVVFVTGSFVKVCVNMLAFCKGVSRVFGFKDYRFAATGVGLLMLNLAYLIYESVIEFSSWDLRVWPYYAFLFQVIFPVLIFLTAIFKKASGKSAPKSGSVHNP